MFSRIEDEVELLQRHIKILKFVIENEPVGIIKLSESSHLPQHKIRYSLRILEQCGMIKPSQKGAITTEAAKQYLNMFPEKIGELIKKIKKLESLN